jgi:uncharacterized protein YndB with AHSA1/START domain
MKPARERGALTTMGILGMMLSSTGCAAGLAERAASPSSVIFRQEVAIAAPAARIWDILVDLPRYAEWNPWLRRAEGDLVPGGVVWADVLLGDRQMRAKHVVLTVEPGVRLCWRDAGWNAAFVYGQRCRTLRPLPDGTVLFRQEILLDGALSGIAERATGSALRTGLGAETAALKARAEAR